MADAAPITPGPFRKVMGLFATGVTVIAAREGDEIHGMTANAITSISLDPLLALVCVDKQARMNRFLQSAGGFSINVLSEDQEALSRYFAGSWKPPAPPEFRFLPWDGGPRLIGCVAAAGCAIDRTVEAGDHWIVVGRVIALHEGDPTARPLVFFGGRYRRLAELEVPVPPEEWSNDAVHIYYDEWSGTDLSPPLTGEESPP
ncbi:MAG: flavin reductase family protein [Armatimonadetes bacterium]|nr:flavin reductase family protein [Armatimonadota bacterium]